MFLLNTKEIVKKILLTPIECNKRYKTIKLVNGEICSPQKYYCGEDCDMSDFAVGFYEIIYANIIPGKKILNNGFFTSKEFAGDTMNSFNSLANIILDNNDKNSRSSKDIWPDYLEKYEKDYHCLANFWVIIYNAWKMIMNLSSMTKQLNIHVTIICIQTTLRLLILLINF